MIKLPTVGADNRAMPAALPGRRLLFGAAILVYSVVFAAVLAFDRAGLGISRLFFVAVVLVALASGPVAGAGGGLLAAVLYVIAVLGSNDLPDGALLTLSMAIRLVTYVGVGWLIGFFAAQQRALTDHLRLLADRDQFTGLPTSRPFEAELTQRLEAAIPFALLLADVDDLGERVETDEPLRRLPEVLGQCLHPSDAIARVGRDEFAIIAACRSSEEAGSLAASIEAAFAAHGLDVTFGWTVSPYEGRNGLALYRAANERLYARRIIRTPRAAASI